MTEKLRRDLEGKTREKEEVLVQLEAQQPVGAHGIDFVHPLIFSECKDKFDVCEFLLGGLGELPSRPNPRASTSQEVRQVRAVRRCSRVQ